MAGRKKAIIEKKKVVRKVGAASKGKEPTITSSWRITNRGKRAVVSFSRDNMNVYLDGSPIECVAYITDNGYDLDLIFNLGEAKGHIYSDVEGTEMTNYLFFNEQLVGQDKQTNLKSDHRPEEF